MRDFLREHSWAVVVSVLLHGLLVAGLVLTALNLHKTPPSLQPLPIDAVVVDSQVLHAAQRAQEEAAQGASRARARRVEGGERGQSQGRTGRSRAEQSSGRGQGCRTSQSRGSGQGGG